jgi:hypothetical protein
MLGAEKGKGDRRRNSWASFVKFGPRQQLRHGPQQILSFEGLALFFSRGPSWARRRNFKTINQLGNSSQTSSLLKMRKKNMKNCSCTHVLKSSTVKRL